MKYRYGLIMNKLPEGYLDDMQVKLVDTPWGQAKNYCGRLNGTPTAIMLRYGDNACTSTQRVNFKAKMWALKKLGVEYIVAQNAIGSCNPDIHPGDYLVPHDVVDFTKTRSYSFFDGADCWVRVDMTDPFCEPLRQILLQVAGEQGLNPLDKGVFASSEGPRFESAAEIAIMGKLGCDIVGTPTFPEVVLAREACICYASFAMVINMCTGLAPDVAHDEMMRFSEEVHMTDNFKEVFRKVAALLPESRTCRCTDAFEKGITGEAPEWWFK